MKNMSFAMTTKQVLAGTKWVTRRWGWLNLKPGDLVQPVLKGMGLKKGEKVQKLRAPIRVIGARREPLSDMHKEPRATIAEGFPEMTTQEFIDMLCKHRKEKESDLITRIAFEYTD